MLGLFASPLQSFNSIKGVWSAYSVRAYIGETVKQNGETIKVYRNDSTTPYEISLTISNDVTMGFYLAPTHSIKFKNFRKKFHG